MSDFNWLLNMHVSSVFKKSVALLNNCKLDLIGHVEINKF